jgi:hypothetical protein
VTGGYVYRGPIASFDGRYFFADFGRGRIWSAIWDGSPPDGFDGGNYSSLVDHGDDPAFVPDEGSIDSISSFGEDSDGNLYVLDHGDGEVFLLPEPNVDFALWTAIGVGLVCDSLLRRRRIRRSPGPDKTAPCYSISK